MNPVGGAASLPVEARTDAGDLYSHEAIWPGLASAAGSLGVALDPSAGWQFNRYRDLLLERSAQFNLTAIRDPAEIERRLFLDTLAMIPALDESVGNGYTAGERAPRLIDVGSGAGFPGMALKIARPQLDVILVDATAKKVAFLNEVIADLELEGVRAVHGRAEELGRDRSYRQRFAIATARAVASLPVLLEYVVPFLAVGGTALLPKGLQIADELREGRRAAALLGAEILAAETLPTGCTRLVITRKFDATPAAYPRRSGVPTRSPLGMES